MKPFSPNIFFKFYKNTPTAPPLKFRNTVFGTLVGAVGPLPKSKSLALCDPQRGSYGGLNFYLSPLPPQIPLDRFLNAAAQGPGSIPATIPEILVKLRATGREIFSLSYWIQLPTYTGNENFTFIQCSACHKNFAGKFRRRILTVFRRTLHTLRAPTERFWLRQTVSAQYGVNF